MSLDEFRRVVLLLGKVVRDVCNRVMEEVR